MKKILLSMFLLGTLLSANAQVPSYVPSNGLVGWWPFNGNANDESGNGNNGSVLPGATFSSNRFGTSNTALQSLGDDTKYSGVEIPINISTSNDFSFSIWFKTTDSIKLNQTIFNTVTHTIIGFGLNHIFTQGKVSGYIGNGNGSWILEGTSNSWKPNGSDKWHNLIYIKNGTSCKTYYDTKLVSNYGPVNLNATITKLLIGTDGQSGNYACFKGLIDDFGYWNRALDLNEINKIYIGCNKSITQQPTNQGMFNGNATFTCATNDTLVNYQWQSDLGMGWNNLSDAGQYIGTTTNTLQVSNVTSSNNNQKFRCVLKGDCLTDTTNDAALKVWGLGIEGEMVDELIVYPNPSSTQVIIDNGNYSTMGSYTAKIVNELGQQVFQYLINQPQFVIDAKSIGGAGVYTLYITDANNKVVGVKKIVLQ